MNDLITINKCLKIYSALKKDRITINDLLEWVLLASLEDQPCYQLKPWLYQGYHVFVAPVTQ